MPIVAAPFTSDGAVDMDSFEKLCHTLARNGCHALTLFGIAGEYYKMNDAERLALAECMIPICHEHGVLAILSVTDHAAEVAVKQARQWESLGADVLMLLPPFFLKPPAAALEAHIRAVGSAVETPVMVQYAPEQTGVPISPDILAGIANDLPTVQDFKIECKPAGHYITRLLDMTNHSVRIHVGNAGYNMIEMHQRGAVGAMPGCSMFDVYLQIHAALQAGDLTTAIDIHTDLLAMLNHIRQNVEMIIAFEKHILMRRGILPNDVCRQPTYPIDSHDQALFDTLFERIQPRFKELS